MCFLLDQTNGGNLFIKKLCQGAKIVSIVCGKCHALILDNDGFVYSFGLGSRGELGHGQAEISPASSRNTPKLVEALVGLKIRQIATGDWHNAALTGLCLLIIFGYGYSDFISKFLCCFSLLVVVFGV